MGIGFRIGIGIGIRIGIAIGNLHAYVPQRTPFIHSFIHSIAGQMNARRTAQYSCPILSSSRDSLFRKKPLLFVVLVTLPCPKTTKSLTAM